MERLLKWYGGNKEPVQIIYMAKNGTITQRNITILKLTNLSVIAYCHLRKTNRTFLYENILSFAPIKKPRKENIAI
ncbi:hypothetical protein [Sutcliffiella deserti]|uniref:hypothetical protein n=1 Tax=Sutcliffiella deserti TaxID=2875501 RepID=UPI001CC00D4F|nr:hypothetical protein [Sutcliffiella deserti]